jgi:hypothetical protein
MMCCTLMIFWYTKVFSTPLNIKGARIFKINGQKVATFSKFINKVKQLLILLQTINLLLRCDVSNTLNVS